MQKDLHDFFCLLALVRIFFTCPKVACDILNVAGSASAVFDGDRKRFLEFFGDKESLWINFKNFKDWRAVECDLKKIEKIGACVIGITDENYPSLLKNIYDPPLAIMVRGNNLNLLNEKAVAIVGSRKAAESNKRVAMEIAEHLSNLGLVVVSGMAYGIDAAAHRGALEGDTGTVAIFGCGVDVIYPSGHQGLSEKIAETGLLVSEFPVGTEPYPAYFPQRNRIVSGMSIASIIVEGAEKSGSLITARFALEQGREVMAVPGVAASPAAAGTNRLIREGAALVERGEDVEIVLSRLMPKGLFPKKTGHFGVDMDKDLPLLKAFKRGSVFSVDELVLLSGLAPSQVLEELTRLVVLGRVIELPGKRFRLKKD